MDDKYFKSQYKLLNPEQKKAVDFTEGPVMVIAGPGTGKTHLLSMRIANILSKTDTPPEGILALTFTESGATSMRARLVQLIGSLAYRVKIATFHGFCNDLILQNPDHFEEIIGSVNISDIEQIKIIGDILDKVKLEKLRPATNPYFYAKQIINLISEIKRQGVDQKELSEIVEEMEEGKMKTRNRDLAKIYTEYQEVLAKSRYYDYNDMIVKTLFALKNDPEFLTEIREEYLYILVDEHQDTNSAQNKILELLTAYSDSPNIFLVGDSKQAIFRFQGASRQNFLHFEKLYPKIKIINLRTNYRSGQIILDASDNILKSQEKLVSGKKEEGEKISVYSLKSQTDEENFIASSLEELIKKGVEPENIAILGRDNRDVFLISLALARFNIPYSLSSDTDITKDTDIAKLLIILKAIKNYGSAQELYLLLHLDFIGIDPLDFYKVSTASYRKRINPYDILKNKKLLSEIGVSDPDKILKLSAKLRYWRILAANEEATGALETIINESGFLPYLLKKDSRKTDKLRALFNSLRSVSRSANNYTLTNFFDYLDIVEENIISKNQAGASGVRVMTAHRAKGIEFDYVYIFGCYQGHWSGRKVISHIKLPDKIYFADNLSDQSDEERNLFYVALTRTKKKLIITYSRQEQSRTRLPSVFLAEIDKDKIRTEEIDQVPILLKKQKKVGKDEKKKLNEIFKDQGFSVSALNNYLSCPWKYFYRNLIRIPEATNLNLVFGTAVHEALRMYFNNPKDKKYLLSRFAQSLRIQPIKKNDYEELLLKGKKALSDYYDRYSQSWREKVILELALNTEFEDLVLTGKIDKLELIDGSFGVRVIDYKTGKPKS